MSAARLAPSGEAFGAKMKQVALEEEAEEAEQAGSLRHSDRLQEKSKWLPSARSRLTDRS